MLGYDTYTDERDFEVAGITGEVVNYCMNSMQYPNIIIDSTEENPMPRYKFEVLHNMIVGTNVEKFDADLLDARIYVYITLNDKMYRIGQIFPKQVKSFLSLFEGMQVYGYLKEEEKIEGIYLYALAS